jgi:hypothetical protein
MESLGATMSPNTIGRRIRVRPLIVIAIMASIFATAACNNEYVYRQVWVRNERSEELVVINEGVFDRTGEPFTIRVGYVVPGNTTRMVVEDHGEDVKLIVLSGTCNPLAEFDLGRVPVLTIVVAEDVSTLAEAPTTDWDIHGQQTDACQVQ